MIPDASRENRAGSGENQENNTQQRQITPSDVVRSSIAVSEAGRKKRHEEYLKSLNGDEEK